ncbi:MAG: nitrate ABC transporter ATP-binding protein [Desulfobacula sp. RIFOXYB2_FULL_45_6]|nr:MAG: nitrate ABC transporter ATP-binding protein [Desulfobacula sp. RIFOXYB2_FULL_45_6]
MHLKCNNLNFTYPDSDVPVIRNLSFSMEAPGFNAVFGPSGVGKTSLAKLIAGMESDFKGDIITGGMDTILYSYNLERLPGWSSTGNHLSRVTPDGKQTLKDKLIDIFELKNILGSRFSKLSMGQQNRINLVRYLLQDFDLLIMDESLANVDEKLRGAIILSIKDLFAGKMFLYISHNLMEVSGFCRDILVFGKPSGNKGCSIIQGRDYTKGYQPDKETLDRTMLEIMNAL